MVPAAAVAVVVAVAAVWWGRLSPVDQGSGGAASANGWGSKAAAAQVSQQ